MKLILGLFSLLISFASFAANDFKTERWTTKNGAQVVFYQAMEVPMLDIHIAFAAGSAYDGEQPGLSALTAQLLNQGNKGIKADELAEKLAETGAQYYAESSRDMAIMGLRTLTQPDALKKATDLFSLILNHPDFKENAFEREKNQQLMAITQMHESPADVANQTFFKALYQNHPYAHPVIGTEEALKELSSQDVQTFYNNFYVGRNAVIVLVGAIDKASAKQLAEKVLSERPSGQKAAAIPDASPLTEEMNIEVPFPSSQTMIRLGQLGIDHHNPNYFPLLIGNYILGGGSLVSQLAFEVREKRGLTYGVYSQFVPLPGKGPFVISLSTKTNQAEKAVDITRKTLTQFVKNGPSAHELAEAKQYLIGSFPLSLASNQSIANMLLKIAFYGLPEDYLDTYVNNIKQVTAAEIKAAFQQKITPDTLLHVSVGQS